MTETPKVVWMVQDESDYYGPDLTGIYESVEAAKAHNPAKPDDPEQTWEHESDPASGHEGYRRGWLHILRKRVQGMPPPPPTPKQLAAERDRLRAETRTPLPYER